MPSVIVLEPTPLVLRETKSFGELVYISQKTFRVFDVEEITKQTAERLGEIGYEPMEDSICLTGAAQKVAIFMSTVANIYQEFQILVFDNKTNKYKQRVFKI